MSEERDPRFDTIAAIDYRYVPEPLLPFLSERAFIAYKCKVEVALVAALCARGMCPQSVVDEVTTACTVVTAEEVYAEEDRVKHDIRALVNRIQRRVSDAAKPFVHMTATSFDISDTANALRYRDAVHGPLHAELKRLLRALVALTRREAETVQIGRTHGQHGVPITFGFAVAGYVSRLGEATKTTMESARRLHGKMAGAVGAYNASNLFFSDPERFEGEVLARLWMFASPVSTQIVQPEPLISLMHHLVLCAGVMADFADDMRHLQRTELGEVGEVTTKDQVGSSTMPHKRNPISFENVKSLWKVLAPRMQTLYMDQLSEHQRDLTNSASGRTYGEIIAYVYAMTERLASVVEKLAVDHERLEHNVRHKVHKRVPKMALLCLTTAIQV